MQSSVVARFEKEGNGRDTTVAQPRPAPPLTLIYPEADSDKNENWAAPRRVGSGSQRFVIHATHAPGRPLFAGGGKLYESTRFGVRLNGRRA